MGLSLCRCVQRSCIGGGHYHVDMAAVVIAMPMASVLHVGKVAVVDATGRDCVDLPYLGSLPKKESWMVHEDESGERLIVDDASDGRGLRGKGWGAYMCMYRDGSHGANFVARN